MLNELTGTSHVLEPPDPTLPDPFEPPDLPPDPFELPDPFEPPDLPPPEPFDKHFDAFGDHDDDGIPNWLDPDWDGYGRYLNHVPPKCFDPDPPKDCEGTLWNTEQVDMMTATGGESTPLVIKTSAANYNEVTAELTMCDPIGPGGCIPPGTLGTTADVNAALGIDDDGGSIFDTISEMLEAAV